MKSLIDSGPLVALVTKRDPWRTRCLAAIIGSKLPLVTTAAVLTEAFYFVHRHEQRVKELWAIVNSSTTVSPITDEDLPALEALMIRYVDRPMDFADATLVHVAERESISTILTIDHDDFETYRFGRNRKFRILPART